MDCKRCQGLMVSDAFIDMDDDSGHLWLGVWRCVNCGEVTDLGVAQNRRRQRSVVSGVIKRFRSSRRPVRRDHELRLTA
jgi:hypothetical protein